MSQVVRMYAVSGDGYMSHVITDTTDTSYDTLQAAAHAYIENEGNPIGFYYTVEIQGCRGAGMLMRFDLED